MKDPTNGRPYYVSPTGQTQWEKPQWPQQPAMPAFAPAPAPAPVPAAFSPAPAAGSGDDVDVELQALVSEMTQLQLGLKKACVTFARSLADEGVMSLQRLRGMQAQDARDILQSTGMKKLQVAAVMQAFCAQEQEEAAAAQKQVHTLPRQRFLNMFEGTIPDAFDCRLLKLLLQKRRRRRLP